MFTPSLKYSFIFVIGFVTGCLINYNLFFYQENSNVYEKHNHNYIAALHRIKLNEELDKYHKDWIVKNAITKTQYLQWLHDNNVKLIDSKMCYHDMKYKQLYTEAQFLASKVKLTCVVLINGQYPDQYYLERVKNSWIYKCDQHFFLRKFKISHMFEFLSDFTKPSNVWPILCHVLEYLVLNGDRNWFIIVPEDTYVIPENARYAVSTLNKDHPFFSSFLRYKLNNGKSSVFLKQEKYDFLDDVDLDQGIITNFAFLEKALEEGIFKCNQLYSSIFFDFLKNTVYKSNAHILDSNLCNRFHKFTMNELIEYNAQKFDEIDFNKPMYDKDGYCVSPTSITFKLPKISESLKENMYDYILYRFNNWPQCYFRKGLPITNEALTIEHWALSISQYTIFTEKEIIAMSDEEYYNMWTNITKNIPQT